MRAKIALNSNALSKLIKNYAVDQSIPQRISTSFNTLLPKIRKEFIVAFKRTVAYKGLIGNYENYYKFDIPAHVGLSPSDAQFAAELIAIIIADQVRFTDVVVRRKSSISFTIETEDVLMALQNRISDNAAGIRWIDWLLGEGPDVAAWIKFGDFTNSTRRYSVSGRAVMVSNGANPGWSAEKYNNFSRTGTFLDDIANDPLFISNIESIVNKHLEKSL